MKYILLLLTSISFAQNVQFSLGFDCRNLVVGSEPTNNKPALDLVAGFTMVSDKGIELSVNYENFNEIGFEKYSFTVGKEFSLHRRFIMIPDLGYGMIKRDLGSNDNSAHLAFQADCGFRYFLSEHFDLELYCNFQQRTDLSSYYGGSNYVLSNYIKILYKIPIGQ